MVERQSRFAVEQAAHGWQEFASSESGRSNSSQERKQQRLSRTPQQRPQQRMSGRAMNDGTHSEACYHIANLPLTWKAEDCFKFFSQWGNISNIHIITTDKHMRGSKGEAKITFVPPPKQQFWLKPIHVLGHGRRNQLSIRPWRDDHAVKRNYERCQVIARRVSAGVMQNGVGMLEMFQGTDFPGLEKQRRHPAHSFAPVAIEVNPDFHEFSINLPVHFTDVDPKSGLNRTDVFRVTFTLKQRLQILYSIPQDSPQTAILAFNSEIVPKCSRKSQEMTSFNNNYNWNERETFCRQVDIALNPTSEALRKRPAGLRHDESIINLGRWTAYSVEIDLTGGRQRPALDRFLNTLRAFNADVQVVATIVRKSGHQAPTIWSFIDPPTQKPVTESVGLSALLNEELPIDFNVRYQLEVCLSGGWLSEYDLSQQWVSQLRRLDPMQACALLEHVASDRPDQKTRRFADPFAVFNLNAPKQSVLAQKIPQGKVLIRSAIITPTTVIFNTPSLEISNRVIRQFSKYSDRFLRIRFLDERTMGRLYGRSDSNVDDEVFTHVKRVLTNGIVVGDRLYDMLAWGNSQFRENGAYFFSNTNEVTAEDIRNWMGDFSDIKVVARYAARIGQCFSTTRAVVGGNPKLFTIPDIERYGFTFTDGVGKISPVFAIMAAQDFKTAGKGSEIPSAYQFRLGGYKGVLTVWPGLKGVQVMLRPSQKKFNAFKSELEIIRHSQATEFCLNRQLIMVLSALGVRDELFLERADQQLSRIHRAMKDPHVARQALCSSVDANHITPIIAEMVGAGFQAANDPFLMSILLLWRSWSIKYLKEKAKINVTHGAVVMGVTDETETLKGHFETDQIKLQYKDINERIKAIPEIFLQLSNFEGTGQSKVVEGLIILARNPSLYDSDIRVVKGVNHERLRHLKDVVVIPQTGDRDLASMCSGGDLDGDDYLVCWDQELIPPEWNPPAPLFESPKPVTRENVTVDDLTTFYVKYMKNAELGQIAHTHLATADRSPLGVKDPKCIRLGGLHSNAVDYPKTGVPATIPIDLKIKEWPHYMGKRKSYHSTSALGQLFDKVQYAIFEPPYDNPFDDRVLNAMPTNPEHETAALEVKTLYDAALRRLMQQHGIKTEFEVWSTFVLKYDGNIGDYKFAEELGSDVSVIKDQYSEMCVAKAGGREWDLLAPFVVAMYKITRDQVRNALYECENIRLDQDGNVMEMRDNSPTSMPFMSFPWLFWHVLCKIVREYQAAMDSELGGLPKWTPESPSFEIEARVATHRARDTEQLANFQGHIDDLVGKDRSGLVLPFQNVSNSVEEATVDELSKEHKSDVPTPDGAAVHDANNAVSLNGIDLGASAEASTLSRTPLNALTLLTNRPTISNLHISKAINSEAPANSIVDLLKHSSLNGPTASSSESSSDQTFHSASEESTPIEIDDVDDADDADELTITIDNSSALNKLGSMFG